MYAHEKPQEREQWARDKAAFAPTAQPQHAATASQNSPRGPVSTRCSDSVSSTIALAMGLWVPSKSSLVTAAFPCNFKSNSVSRSATRSTASETVGYRCRRCIGWVTSSLFRDPSTRNQTPKLCWLSKTHRAAHRDRSTTSEPERGRLLQRRMPLRTTRDTDSQMGQAWFTSHGSSANGIQLPLGEWHCRLSELKLRRAGGQEFRSRDSAGFGERVVGVGAAFDRSRFESVWTVPNRMRSHVCQTQGDQRRQTPGMRRCGQHFRPAVLRGFPQSDWPEARNPSGRAPPSKTASSARSWLRRSRNDSSRSS